MNVDPGALSGGSTSPASISHRLEILAVPGIPDVQPGDDLVELILVALNTAGLELCDQDLVVVAQKIISKVEDRVVELSSVHPRQIAREWARQHGKDARQVQVVLDESVRIVRMDRAVMICETHHGFICANAGIDASNAPPGCVLLLPSDPDASAHRLRVGLYEATGAHIGVIVTDTWGRPWRLGITNVAIGASGIPVVRDHRGEQDPTGRLICSTVVAVADEAAAAAELVMGKISRVPAAIVRGLQIGQLEGSQDAHDCQARSLVRPAEDDLFR